MALFSDENTMEDIHGCYLVARGWPAYCPQFDIHQQLADIVARIEDKLSRNRNPVRKNWFTTALDHAKQAQRCYIEGDVEQGRKCLDHAWEYLESGNKAHRRRTTFMAGPDGQIDSA
jgi:hypothetical protein